jgi:hypothetical protein
MCILDRIWGINASNLSIVNSKFSRVRLAFFLGETLTFCCRQKLLLGPGVLGQQSRQIINGVLVGLFGGEILQVSDVLQRTFTLKKPTQNIEPPATIHFSNTYVLLADLESLRIHLKVGQFLHDFVQENVLFIAVTTDGELRITHYKKQSIATQKISTISPYLVLMSSHLRPASSAA